jgi:hypothetical protein
MDRELWSYPRFTKDSQPKWRCPVCDSGLLRLKKDSLFFEETSSSKASHSHEDWDPGWIHYTFSAFLTCDNCKEPIGVSGWGDIFEGYRYLPNGDVDEMTDDQFYPEYFSKAPKLIEIPVDCDTEIEMEIEKSFQLYFVDPNSCGNKIRSVLESILDEFDIPRKKKITKSAKIEIRTRSLHERILLFGQKNPKAAERLLAIKWIGNFGTHGFKLERNDLLDAYELFEIALSEIYDYDKKRADKLTKAINKKKGPLTKRKKK